jgi:hypothetical protein
MVSKNEAETDELQMTLCAPDDSGNAPSARGDSNGSAVPQARDQAAHGGDSQLLDLPPSITPGAFESGATLMPSEQSGHGVDGKQFTQGRRSLRQGDRELVGAHQAIGRSALPQ